MPRELTWLENSTFAAWGCSACNWIFPNPSPREDPSKPSAKVLEAFHQHDCAMFPRTRLRSTRPRKTRAERG